MMNRNESDAGIDTRLRLMRIVWAAFVGSVGLNALIAYFAVPKADAAGAGAEQSPLLYILFALGFSSVTASYLFRRNFYGKAEREGRPELVYIGLIIALAICETAALFGLAVLFVLSNTLGYFLFALAAAGHFLHFPQRDQLIAASRGVGRTM